MYVIALAQQKGGVGKSSASVNLACQVVESGGRAAVIDLDAEQASSSKWGRRRSERPQPVVLPSDAQQLGSILSTLKSQGVDWVFLDLPGRSHPVSGAGMKASDFIIIPCRPNDVDIEPSLDTVEKAKRQNKPYSYLMNIVPAQKDQKRAKQVANLLRAHGHDVSEIVIVQRIDVSDAFSDGLGVNEYKPQSASSKEFSSLFKWLEKKVEGLK